MPNLLAFYGMIIFGSFWLFFEVGKFYLIFQTIPCQLENQIKFAHLATPLSARQGVGKFYLIFQLTGDGLDNQIKFAHLKRTVKPDGF